MKLPYHQCGFIRHEDCTTCGKFDIKKVQIFYLQTGKTSLRSAKELQQNHDKLRQAEFDSWKLEEINA